MSLALSQLMKLRIHVTFLIVFLLGGTEWACGEPPQTPAGSTTISGVQLGFDGLYHAGAWTPLLVKCEGAAPELELEMDVPDPDDNVTTYRTGVIKSSPDQNRHSLSLLFKTGRLEFDFVVRILDGSGKKLSEQKLHAGGPAKLEIPGALPYSTHLWIGIGNPAGFDDDTAVQPAVNAPESGEMKVTRGNVRSLSHLPADPLGYEGVDALILAFNGVDQDQHAIAQELEKHLPQVEAIRRWVASGGVLFISVGDHLEEFRNSSLAKWLPLLPASQGELRLFSPLQAFTGKSVKFDGAVPMTFFNVEPRQVVLRGTASPLVVEGSSHFGRVFFSALDLEKAPFLKWEGLTRYYEQVLTKGIERSEHGTTQGSSTRLSHGGVTELASQWTRSVANIEGVSRTSLWGNLLLLLVYLIVVGPVDYLIVCRWLKRPEWTWISLPILLAVTGGLGLVYARSSNGTALKSHTISVIDIDQKDGEVHGRSWFSLYSPQTRRISVQAEPKPLSPRQEMSLAGHRIGWWGLPESSIGGLYRSGGLQFGRKEYAFGTKPDQIERMPVQIWSTKTLESEWSGTGQPVLANHLESSGLGNLRGSLAWKLPEPLLDCMLVFGNRVYFPKGRRGSNGPPQLSEGFVWEPAIGSQTSQRELRGFLTKLQTRAIQKEGSSGAAASELQTIASAYDSLSRNANDIMPILSFYEYSGGANYTLLMNDMLAKMDWSHHLRLGQAVLFGRIAGTPLKISIDGGELAPDSNHRHMTFIRCLLPVEKTQGRDLRDFESPLKK